MGSRGSTRPGLTIEGPDGIEHGCVKIRHAVPLRCILQGVICVACNEEAATAVHGLRDVPSFQRQRGFQFLCIAQSAERQGQLS
jgi:hypothetical protein